MHQLVVKPVCSIQRIKFIYSRDRRLMCTDYLYTEITRSIFQSVAEKDGGAGVRYKFYVSICS